MTELSITPGLLLTLMVSAGAAVAVYLDTKKGSSTVPARGDLYMAITAAAAVATVLMSLGLASTPPPAAHPGAVLPAARQLLNHSGHRARGGAGRTAGSSPGSTGRRPAAQPCTGEMGYAAGDDIDTSHGPAAAQPTAPVGTAVGPGPCTSSEQQDVPRTRAQPSTEPSPAPTPASVAVPRIPNPRGENASRTGRPGQGRGGRGASARPAGRTAIPGRAVRGAAERPAGEVRQRARVTLRDALGRADSERCTGFPGGTRRPRTPH